jgi:hypothetical protein
MAERKVKNQSVNLILDHYKSGITLNYMLVGGMPHIIGKLLKRATTLL